MRYIMCNIRFICFFTLSIVILSQIGCEQNRDTTSTSTPTQQEENKDHNDENKELTTEVTIGGKVWKINPKLSYQATGVWTNPDPRPLTDAEKSRIQVITDDIATLKTQLDKLDKELNFLQRIDQPEIKVRYSFGKPPYPLPKPSDFSADKITDLGEFPMEMENPTKVHLEK